MNQQVKERGILFKGEMVRALLDGRKTQTRRAIKDQPIPAIQGGFNILGLAGENDWAWPDPKLGWGCATVSNKPGGPDGWIENCPYGKAGDRLWVRETWRGVVRINPPGAPTELGVARYVPDQEHCSRIEYKATQAADSEPYRPSIHMPRWASRILLEITDVRIERLQDISEADAVAEGLYVETHHWRDSEYPLPDVAYRITASASTRYSSGADAYKALWQSINGPDSWSANPWVWVVEFRRIKQERSA